MAVLARQDAGSRGTADGIGTERVVKDGPFVCDSVQIRSFVDLGSVSTDGLQGMVVGKQEDNVGPFGLGRFVSRRGARQEAAEHCQCNCQRDTAFPEERNLARIRLVIHVVAGVSGGKFGGKPLV